MRTYSTRSGCPAAVSVTVPIGTLRIEVREPGELEPDSASVSLAPALAGDEAAEQAIAEATITESGGTLTVAVPYRPAAFARTGFATNVIAGHGGQVIQSTGNITIVNGRIIGGANVVQVPSGAVEAVLSVPASARLLLDGQDTSITVTGPASQITAASTNGSIRIEQAETAVAEASNGSIHVGEVVNVEATTANGSVHVERVTGSAVLRTTNGSIHAHTTTSDFSARSTNGNVKVSAEGVTLLDSAARTAHGLARVR